MCFAIGAAIERNMILTALIDRAGNAFVREQIVSNSLFVTVAIFADQP